MYFVNINVKKALTINPIIFYGTGIKKWTGEEREYIIPNILMY